MKPYLIHQLYITIWCHLCLLLDTSLPPLPVCNKDWPYSQANPVGAPLADMHIIPYLPYLNVCHVFWDDSDEGPKVKDVGLTIKLLYLLVFWPLSTELPSPCTLDVGEFVPESLNLILQAYHTYLPITSFSVITTGSLAVSVTDMTAPVVGSSGGVYALVSAHLANVVMVSLFVCARVCRWLSHHSAVLSLQNVATSSKQPVLGPSRCCSICRCHTFLTITISFSFSQRSESVCACLCDSMWGNLIPLHSDICVCSVGSERPVHRHMKQKALRWTSVTCNRVLIVHPAWSSTTSSGSELRSLSSSSSAEILLSNTARTDCGSECLWGFSKLTWIETEGEISCHFMSACVCACVCVSEEDVTF